MEEGSQSPETDSIILSREKPDIQASKKRKVGEKTVVTVKIEENEGKQRSELGPPPSDCWSWRKYGQKPIKGSPYPRGYYKCSTSKGCLAKKQVERCRTDASMLIITYTSTHNHPSPTSNLTKEPKQTKIQSPDHQWPADQRDQEEQEQEEEEEEQGVVEEEQQQPPLEMTTNYNINAEGESSTHHDNNGFHYCQSPIRTTHQGIIISPEDEMINPFSAENHHHHLLLDIEEPISSYPHHDHLMSMSTVLKSSSSSASSDQDQGNDFYDELEELPMSSSSFTSFMRTNFFEERILVQLS